MEENSEVELFMISYWTDYLAHIIICVLALPVLTVIYFFIKRRYTSTQTLVVEQNSTEESEIYTSSENVFNESSFESLNLELEKKNELLYQPDKKNESSEVLRPLSKYIGTETEDNKRHHVLEDSLNYNELFYTTSKFDIKKTMDTVYSNYGYNEDEMQECNNFTKFQDVLDSSKLNSDSHSTINSWKSCNKDISHSESDYLNSLCSENPEISQPLNLCTKGNKNETETIEKKTFFTDRRHKKSKDKLMVYPENFFCYETIKDEQHSSLFYDKIKNLNYFYNKEYSLNAGNQEQSLENTENGEKHENYLEIPKVSIINHSELENKDNLNNTEVSTINHSELENEDNLDNTEISTINHSELENEDNLDNTEVSTINHSELENEDNLDNTEISTINHSELENEDNLDNTEVSIINHSELENEDNLDNTEISTINHSELENEDNLDNTEVSIINHSELENEDNLDNTEISTINHSELENEDNLDNTEVSIINHSELENEDNLDNTEISTINHSELENEDNLDNTELFSINHNELGDEYNLGNIKYSLNEDELMLENNLETTKISAINRDESLYEYYLKSPELSLNNDKNISGTDSHNINCIRDYETQDITDLNSSSSESTESLPSPIYQNNNSIDDIRYVEDYNDVSFFDLSLSEDAMNQAFVED